jgi:Tfp pilus assembly protein PilV
MIAISVFAIGFLAISSLLFSSSRNNRTASEVTEAITIATDQMERLITIDSTHEDLDSDDTPHQASQGKYNIEWLVSDTDLNHDGVNDAKIINLTISFDRLGQTAPRIVRLDFIRPNV